MSSHEFMMYHILPGVFLELAFPDLAFPGVLQLALTAGVPDPFANGDNGIPLDWPCNFFCHLGTGPDDISVMVQDFRHSLIPASKVLGSMKTTARKKILNSPPGYDSLTQ